MAQTVNKVVICGAGFLGSNIAKHLLAASADAGVRYNVQLSSRQPANLYERLSADSTIPDQEGRLTAVPVDITSPSTLEPAFSGASVVVSLVGIMHGSPTDFERLQWHGAENVARAAKDAGAKLVHFSAIGANERSHIPYVRTKGLGERAVFDVCPEATIIRPSLVFGPGDGFFARFATLAKVLPFLPVFGGGVSRFQPVFVGDLARAVERIASGDPAVRQAVDGRTLETGGPDVFTYRECMELVLRYSGRRRPILSLPFEACMIQGSILEKLPTNLFTVTRAQVEQLREDNVVNPHPPPTHASFETLVSPLTSVHDVLPSYLG